MGAETSSLAGLGRVMGTKLTRNEIDQINRLIDAGIYLNSSDFIHEAVREKLAAIKVIEYRDIDFETAKREVSGYFKMKGDAYASDASADLELDYDLVCRIMDGLEKEGKLEAMNKGDCFGRIQ
jgi:Arc/MetJ-type ribon-helix-helix transcriptional regulator